MKTNTHIVIKREDVFKYLTNNQIKYLDAILDTIIDGRKKDGKKTDNSYYICNTDEPYADEVLEVIRKAEGEMGYWIIERDPNGKDVSYHCSKCYENSGFFTTSADKFCPNCGKKMHKQPIEEQAYRHLISMECSMDVLSLQDRGQRGCLL